MDPPEGLTLPPPIGGLGWPKIRACVMCMCVLPGSFLGMGAFYSEA